jgi:hypothetical protein
VVDEPVGQLLRRGDVLNGRDGATLQLSLPAAGSGDCPQYMWFLLRRLGGLQIGRRQDTGPPLVAALCSKRAAGAFGKRVRDSLEVNGFRLK